MERRGGIKIDNIFLLIILPFTPTFSRDIKSNRMHICSSLKKKCIVGFLLLSSSKSSQHNVRTSIVFFFFFFFSSIHSSRCLVSYPPTPQVFRGLWCISKWNGTERNYSQQIGQAFFYNNGTFTLNFLDNLTDLWVRERGEWKNVLSGILFPLD